MVTRSKSILFLIRHTVRIPTNSMAAQLHVVVIPWSAFGHLMPFFQLSISLAKSGIKVSFISTPRNIQRLPKIPPFLESLIQFVEIPLPKLENEYSLPESAEATVDIPMERIQHLKIAYDLLKHPFREYISKHLPDWILFDFIPYWVVEIAAEHKIPTVNFSVFSAPAYVFFGHLEYLVGDERKKVRPDSKSLTSPPPWVDFPSSLAYRDFEASGMFEGFYGENASGTTDAERFFESLQGCQAVAIRSCPEHEGEYLDLFERMLNKPVIPVGLLLPERPEDNKFKPDLSWSQIFNWLDKQEPKSVVFVGFGSECKLSKEQVYEIAYGLELSGLSFLWALRKPAWADDDDLNALPVGFSERMQGRGVVHIGWAPQIEILSHPAIGGSLFHSGWGSVIETLQFGHCLVLLPFIIDQALNARVLVEKGLAVEVQRSEDGSFSRDGIADALKLALASEEGESLRVRAKEAGKYFGDHKLQDGYFSKFVEYLKSGARK